MPALIFERPRRHCQVTNQLHLKRGWHAFVLIPVSSVFHDSALDNPEPANPNQCSKFCQGITQHNKRRVIMNNDYYYFAK